MPLLPAWRAPKVQSDWGEEYEERSAGWWELFHDLVIVAAMSNIADGLEEDPCQQRGLAFVLTFSLFYNGWFCHALFTTRFIEQSVLQSLLLLLYTIGTAIMVVNASDPLDRNGFSQGVIIQRTALIITHVHAYVFCERGRKHLRLDIFNLCVSVCFTMVAASTTDKELMMCMWAGSALIETFGTYFEWSSGVVTLHDLIPVNIEHTEERMGCWFMVVLGESIVSTVINYKDIKYRGMEYYLSMSLGLSISFCLALLVFSVSPPRRMHALRRSILHSMGYFWANQFMTLSLLGVGVGFKWVTAAVVAKADTMDSLRSSISFLSLAGALCFMITLRALHYWGRSPGSNHTPRERRLLMTWWYVHIGSCFLTVALGLVVTQVGDNFIPPFAVLYLQLAICGTMVLLETVFVQTLLFWGVTDVTSDDTRTGSKDSSQYALLHPSGDAA